MQAYTTKIRRGTLISDAALAADNTTTYFHGLSSISMPGMKRTTVEASSNEDLEEVERGRPRGRVSCVGKRLTGYNEPPYNPRMAIHPCSPAGRIMPDIRGAPLRDLQRAREPSIVLLLGLHDSGSVNVRARDRARKEITCGLAHGRGYRFGQTRVWGHTASIGSALTETRAKNESGIRQQRERREPEICP